MSSLAAWESFYVIVGSSAAALTGLQFVVMALIAETRRRAPRETVDAFGTPTILHFAFVLLLASILTAPWPTLSGAAIALGVCGVVGVGYVCIVSRRTRRQTGYQPVLEDWIWHIALPLLAYAALTAAAFALRRYALTALFVVGGVSLLLLFAGIHNAWDSVTYIIFDQPQGPERE